jgi:lipopolysaccharide export system protein LptC
VTSLRNTWVLVLLAALAGATWLASLAPAPVAPLVDGGDERPLGYYLRGARLVGTDESGRVAYRIHAERLDERPEQELLELTGVAVEYQPADDTPWRISAAAATAPKDGSQLDLKGSVELESAPTDGSRPVRIATEELRFFPGSSSVESDETVTIHVGDWRLSAKGLRTHLKGDSLELESEVHGRFGP